MATKHPIRQTLATAREAAAEARKNLALEAQERDAAKTILNPDEVWGDYDFGRMLFTTLGGSPRPLTVDDLKQFRYQSQQLGKKFKGGIKAKQVIDASLPVDRERANKQITMAMPVNHRAGTVHFQTNAGPDSDKQRHHVYVEFLNFSAAVASPKPADKIVGEVLKGYVKLECDCGRWRFWFRYVATIGRYNQGRPETGYPKIRNPNLHGVACKHILRVMQLSTASPTFKHYMVRMIEQARQSMQVKTKAVTVKEMADFHEKMRKEKSRTRKVLTTEEKQKARGYTPKERKAREKFKKDVESKVAKRDSRTAKKVDQAAKQIIANAAFLLKNGAIDKAMHDAMVNAVRNKR